MRKTLFPLTNSIRKSQRLSIPIPPLVFLERGGGGREDVSGRLFQSAIFFRSFFACIFAKSERVRERLKMSEEEEGREEEGAMNCGSVVLRRICVVDSHVHIC